jgi:uncharacterized protein
MLLALLLFAAGLESKTLPPGIPLTIVHGAKPGPALALIAGNHGYEYPPILALQRLRAELDPKVVSGTIYLVHVANVPGFQGRSLFTNPVDGKNLNRVYPGKADGTLSEQIAYAITTEVIEKSDALIDLHSGDGNESLRPYAYQELTGNAAMDAKIAALVTATLFDHIVIDRDRPSDPAKAMYCSNAAITRGKPAVTVESGYMGTRDHESVDRLVRAVQNVMRHLGMLPGAALQADHPVYLDPVEILPSPATGIFYPHVERGTSVEKGAVLAHVTDYFGKTIGEIRAPFAGEVLYIIGTPPVNEGNPAVFIGAVKH